MHLLHDLHLSDACGGFCWLVFAGFAITLRVQSFSVANFARSVNNIVGHSFSPPCLSDSFLVYELNHPAFSLNVYRFHSSPAPNRFLIECLTNCKSIIKIWNPNARFDIVFIFSISPNAELLMSGCFMLYHQIPYFHHFASISARLTPKADLIAGGVRYLLLSSVVGSVFHVCPTIS